MPPQRIERLSGSTSSSAMLPYRRLQQKQPYEPFSFVAVPIHLGHLKGNPYRFPFWCPRYCFKAARKGTSEKASDGSLLRRKQGPVSREHMMAFTNYRHPFPARFPYLSLFVIPFPTFHYPFSSSNLTLFGIPPFACLSLGMP